MSAMLKILVNDMGLEERPRVLLNMILNFSFSTNSLYLGLDHLSWHLRLSLARGLTIFALRVTHGDYMIISWSTQYLMLSSLSLFVSQSLSVS